MQPQGAAPTYDRSLVDETEEPAHAAQELWCRVPWRGCVAAAGAPWLLLTEHRGAGRAQKGGRANEEKEHDQERAKVEERRLRRKTQQRSPRFTSRVRRRSRGARAAHHAPHHGLFAPPDTTTHQYSTVIYGH